MSASITRAMIMGAGLGTRMRPLTDDRPKPLVTVAGRTLLDHAMDRLVAAGVTRIVVNIHYHADMMRAHLARRADVEIVISDESDALLDTGGGVVRALRHFGDAPFFIHNSDTIWIEHGAPALPAMARAWDAARMDGLLMLAETRTAIGYDGRGDFMRDSGGRLGRVPKGQISPFAYPGVQIVHARLFADAPAGSFSTNLMWDRAIAQGRLYGQALDGVWLHVGTPEAVREAEAMLRPEPA